MTTTYATGNPLGSNSPKDLSDNASNVDEFANSPSPSFEDRFGRRRETLTGLKYEVEAAVASIGFTPIADYAAGVTFTSRNQYTVRNGVALKLSLMTELPYTITGDWEAEKGNFVAFNPDYKALTVKDFGAVGDGLTDDTAAFRLAYAILQRVKVPEGKFLITGKVGSLTDGKGIVWEGEGGADSTVIFEGDGGLFVSGKGWEIYGIHFMPSGVVPFIYKTGTVDDNHGGSFHNNLIETDTNEDYFELYGDHYSAWYCRIYDNFCRNGLFNIGFNGTGFRFSYSVNNVISGNTIGANSIAVDVTNIRGPNGNVCEGITLSNNIILANDIHFRATAGLLFQLDNNIFDLTSPSGTPILIDGAFCVLGRGNWIAGHNPCILRNGDRHIFSDNVFSGLDVNKQLFAIENSNYGQFTNNNMLSGSIALGANEGCGGWLINDNQFTGQTVRACDLTLLTDSQYANNRENQNPLPSLLGNTVYSSPGEFVYTDVAVANGEASKQFTVNLPQGRFTSRPKSCSITIQSGVQPLIAIYNFDESTAAQIKFTLYPISGGLPGNIRFGLTAKQ